MRCHLTASLICKEIYKLMKSPLQDEIVYLVYPTQLNLIYITVNLPPVTNQNWNQNGSDDIYQIKNLSEL